MMVFEATYGQNIYTLAYIFTHFPGSLGRANCVYLNGPFLYTSRCRYSPFQMAPNREPFYCCICYNNLSEYNDKYIYYFIVLLLYYLLLYIILIKTGEAMMWCSIFFILLLLFIIIG